MPQSESYPRHPEATTRHSETQGEESKPSRHSERSEESTCNKEILQSHSFLQNDDLTCHPESTTRHSEAQAEESVVNREILQSHSFLQNDNLTRHPGGFPLCRENVTKCHIFERWRRVNESEPSQGSEQIEHTKTECLYAKLCEREGNPRQLVSGSYQPGDSTADWSDSEHTRLS